MTRNISFMGIDVTRTGRNLRHLREERGFTVSDVCDELGITERAWYKWQQGVSMPNLDNLVILSNMFQVPMDGIIVLRERDP